MVVVGVPVPVPALSQAFTGEPAPRQVLALPVQPQTGVLSKRGWGGSGQRGDK